MKAGIRCKCGWSYIGAVPLAVAEAEFELHSRVCRLAEVKLADDYWKARATRAEARIDAALELHPMAEHGCKDETETWVGIRNHIEGDVIVPTHYSEWTCPTRAALGVGTASNRARTAAAEAEVEAEVRALTVRLGRASSETGEQQ